MLQKNFNEIIEKYAQNEIDSMNNNTNSILK